MMVPCYLEKENNKFLKFHSNNFSYVEIRGFLLKALPSNNCRTLELRY